LEKLDEPSAPWKEVPDLLGIAREQGVGPVTDLRRLRGDFWPEDENIDDFIAAVREWRREGTVEDE
jgi:hypothetical protein